MLWWRGEAVTLDWAQTLGQHDPDTAAALRRCTHAGRPFGNETFVADMAHRFGRYWTPGRPPKRVLAPLS